MDETTLQEDRDLAVIGLGRGGWRRLALTPSQWAVFFFGWTVYFPLALIGSDVEVIRRWMAANVRGRWVLLAVPMPATVVVPSPGDSGRELVVVGAKLMRRTEAAKVRLFWC